jgi:hypothetical protein
MKNLLCGAGLLFASLAYAQDASKDEQLSFICMYPCSSVVQMIFLFEVDLVHIPS